MISNLNALCIVVFLTDFSLKVDYAYTYVVGCTVCT